MIVTLDDYRGAADSRAGLKNDERKEDDCDFEFTVAKAGHLKLTLQALNSLLARTPLDRHAQLQFDDILQSAPPRTYVNGSEEVYFLVKSLSWPSKLPVVFANAYNEVVQSRPFTNRYISKPLKTEKLKYFGPASTTLAPTFSSIRLLLPEIDTLCNTSLGDFFEKADRKSNPFPFMRLPAELRLHIYDYLVPSEAFIRIRSKRSMRIDQRLPLYLDIVRVSRTLHEETTKHFFSKPTLLIEACKEPIGYRKLECFTNYTESEYARLVSSMSVRVRCGITRLEIRIVSGMPGEDDDPVRDESRETPLRKICAALPNLELIVVSFQRKEEWRKTSVAPTPWKARGAHFNSQSLTLDWIYTQLSSKGPQVAWDLTHFRCLAKDAVYLREQIMSEWIMREQIEREGGLQLEKSVTVTREDSQMWSDMKDLVLEALRWC